MEECVISHIDEKDFSYMRLKLSQLCRILFIASAIFFLPMTILCVTLTWFFAVEGLTIGSLIHFFLLLSFMLGIGVFFYLPSKRHVLKSSHKQIELHPRSICVIYQRENFTISIDELCWQVIQSWNPLFSDDLCCGIQKRGIIFKDSMDSTAYYMPLDDNEMMKATEWLRNSKAKELKDNNFLCSFFLLLLPATGILLFLMLGVVVCLIMNVDYGFAIHAICFGCPIMVVVFFYLYSTISQ